MRRALYGSLLAMLGMFAAGVAFPASPPTPLQYTPGKPVGLPPQPMQQSMATSYGPGLYGNPVACGGTLQPGSAWVAHRYMACGTKVQFCSRGKCTVLQVRDRGPYTSATFDLTEAAVARLGYGSATAWGRRYVRWRVVR
jgi:rare lipoprotein A (peptidoglycan hydrolase)